MLFFLYGPDTFRSRQKLKELKEKFLREVDSSGLNLVTLEGKSLTLAKFQEAVSVSSFLARKRMVVVENVIKEHKGKKIHREITDYLNDKKFPAETIVIFWEEAEADKKPPKSNPLWEKLRHEKYAQEFRLLKGASLEKWARDKAKELGAKLTSPALNLLIAAAGENLWQLNNELEKLSAYAGKGEIKEEHVKELVKGRIDDNIFHLVDALVNKDKKEAMRLINDQIGEGVNELYLLTMIARQFRILLQVREMLDKGGQRETGKLKLHPFVLSKAMQQARKYKLADLKKIYGKLLEIDRGIKTSKAKPILLFDLLVAEVC